MPRTKSRLLEGAVKLMVSQAVPFTTNLLLEAQPSPCSCYRQNPPCENSTIDQTWFVDSFPALYHCREDGTVRVPGDRPIDFLERDLSLSKLEKVQKHLWFAGNKRPTAPLHYQISIGRSIVLTESMDLHLLWLNDGTLFVKPIPHYLLDSSVWKGYLTCPSDCANCAHTAPPGCLQKKLRKCALGFLFSFACLISYQSDFEIALEKHLVPKRNDGSNPCWQDWKRFVREVIAAYQAEDVHERFHRGELRLSRLNTIHRFSQLPPFDPYFSTWHHYGDLFRENLTWLATATVFIALILTAMQVGLTIERLNTKNSFVNASYGFTILAIIGPIGVLGLVFVAALYNLLKDLPHLRGLTSKSPKKNIIPPPMEGRQGEGRQGGQTDGSSRV